MSVVYIGHCDVGCIPDARASFLSPFHNVSGSQALKGKVSFRDDDRKTWRKFRELSDSRFTVSNINEFLHSAGFMPRARPLPVFDYVTQSAARLFQEYLRTMEGQTDIKPDGFVGQKTIAFMQQWMDKGKTCEWGDRDSPSSEYIQWINSLNLAKQHYAQNQPDLLRQVAEHPAASDSLAVSDWTFSPNDIHLVGLRSGEHLDQKRRVSDDLFILLINGQVFKFWGSTDPNAELAERPDEPFLVEGQHKYRFSWHKINSDKQIYRALRPYGNGVLVFRDNDNDNALTAKDIQSGLDKQPNPTINIHWSGIGGYNWSAGCQVIAGKSYINPAGRVIDCSAFAARKSSELDNTHRKTKGAYNTLADLILCYAPAQIDHLYYTLGRDDTLLLSDVFDADYLKRTFRSMQV